MNVFHYHSIRPAVIGIGMAIALAGSGHIAPGASNPFQEIEALETKMDLRDPVAVRQLMENARRLTLHGTARRYARALAKLTQVRDFDRKISGFGRLRERKSFCDGAGYG
jgi:hypothetical protein